MKPVTLAFSIIVLAILALVLNALPESATAVQAADQRAYMNESFQFAQKATPTRQPQVGPTQRPPQKTPGAKDKDQPGPGSFTMEQTLSDNAQEMTIAFDGLAFLTGNLGSDSFFPPGKVADFWGFQYLRDNDPSEMGHNTDFLTRASLNMLVTLSADQKAQLIALAKQQVNAINEYGLKRFVLMTAFRRLLNKELPSGTTGLNESAVKAFSADLYRLDGKISLERAQVMGSILYSLNTQQKAYLAAMVGKGMTTWPDVQEPSELRGLSRDEKIAVMTYAGDMFSWYAGSLEADVYFCRHGKGVCTGAEPNPGKARHQFSRYSAPLPKGYCHRAYPSRYRVTKVPCRQDDR